MKRVRAAFVAVGVLAANTALAQPPARPQRPPDPRTAGAARPAPAKSPAEALIDRANVAADAGRHQEALGLYDQALTLDPKAGIARHLRGELKAKMGDCKGAVVDLDAAEKALVFEDMLAVVGFFATRGDCHFDLGDFPAAIEDFERQVRNEQTDHYSWSMLGFAYSKAGRHAEAVLPLRKSIELAPKSSYYLVMMGEALSRAKSHDEAFDYYRRALAIDPNSAHAYRAMSLDYIALNRLDDARASLQAVLRLDPTNEPMRKLLAAVETDIAKASAAPTAATAVSPVSVNVWQLDTTAVTVANGCADGLAKVDAVIRDRIARQAPADVEAYHRRARCRIEARDYAAALGDYQTVARVRGRYEDFVDLGITQRMLKQYEQAVANFQRAIGMDPRRPFAYVNLGVVHEDRQEWAAANAAYDEALRVEPANTKALEGKGVALYHMRDNAQAVNYLTRALSDQPDNWRILAHRASSYDRLNRPAEAIADFNRVLALNPGDVSMYRAFASVYSTRGDYQQAIRLLEAARARAPQDQQVLGALEDARRGAAGRTVAAAGTPPPPPPPARSYPPVDPRSTLGRGIRLYLDIEYQQALPLLTQATKENPSDPRGFAYLAAAYFKLSLPREFEAARDRAVALDPGIMRTVP